jgi:hypothetical protein
MRLTLFKNAPAKEATVFERPVRAHAYRANAIGHGRVRDGVLRHQEARLARGDAGGRFHRNRLDAG